MNDLYIAGGFLVIAAVVALVLNIVSKIKPPVPSSTRTERVKVPIVADAPGAQNAKAQAFLKNRIDAYDGKFTLEPFGHDIISPPRRDVPKAYHGTWLKSSLLGHEKPEQWDGYARLEITSDELRFNGVSYPVVLVDDTGTNSLPESEVREIAIVCEETDEYGWRFWMMTLSLQEGRTKLVDVESIGSPWTRVS